MAAIVKITVDINPSWAACSCSVHSAYFDVARAQMEQTTAEDFSSC